MANASVWIVGFLLMLGCSGGGSPPPSGGRQVDAADHSVGISEDRAAAKRVDRPAAHRTSAVCEFLVERRRQQCLGIPASGASGNAGS